MNHYRSAAGAIAVEQRYREILAAWPVPSRQFTIPTRAGDTFVVASGPEDAPPVIALQGSGANAAYWLRQIPGWSQHLRVYAVDVPGEPGLSTPARPTLASGAYSAWLGDVQDALGLTHTALAGISLGGWIATSYATDHPERVTRLAVISPSGIGPVRPRFLLTALLLRPFGEWGLRRTLRVALGPAVDTSGADPSFPLLVARNFRPRRERIPTFTDGQLRRLTMPVLAVLGAQDALLDSRDTARRIGANIPSATVVLAQDAGHHLPDQTTAAAAFLHQGGGA